MMDLIIIWYFQSVNFCLELFIVTSPNTIVLILNMASVLLINNCLKISSTSKLSELYFLIYFSHALSSTFPLQHNLSFIVT